MPDNDLGEGTQNSNKRYFLGIILLVILFVFFTNAENFSNKTIKEVKKEEYPKTNSTEKIVEKFEINITTPIDGFNTLRIGKDIDNCLNEGKFIKNDITEKSELKNVKEIYDAVLEVLNNKVLPRFSCIKMPLL